MPIHRCQQCWRCLARSCALYCGSITVRRAGTKLVAKVRSQIRKKSVKGRVACSTELAGCLFDPPKVLSPLLVCCRFIRYQSDLPLVSRGFSAASGMRTKCPPELQSGSGRVLDLYTPTRDTLTLTWGRSDVKSRRKPPSFSAMFGAFNALLRAVPWVHHREESMP